MAILLCHLDWREPKTPLGAGMEVAHIIFCLKHSSKAEFESSALIRSMEERLRKDNIQAVAWLPYIALTHIYRARDQ